MYLCLSDFSLVVKFSQKVRQTFLDDFYMTTDFSHSKVASKF